MEFSWNDIKTNIPECKKDYPILQSRFFIVRNHVPMCATWNILYTNLKFVLCIMTKYSSNIGLLKYSDTYHVSEWKFPAGDDNLS